MFASLRQHRAVLARANEQQEARVDTPLQDTYLNYGPLFRNTDSEQEVPPLPRTGIDLQGTTTNLETQKLSTNEDTAQKQEAVRDTDSDDLTLDRKDYAHLVYVPIIHDQTVRTTATNKNDIVTPVIEPFSNLDVTPKAEQPYKGTTTPEQSANTSNTQASTRPETATAQSLYAEFRATELARRQKSIQKGDVALPSLKGPDRASG